MDIDNETWIINEGDRIIHNKSDHGYESLSDLEKAIYYFWIIDYAVRNSGTLQPMRDMNKYSISELIKFAKENECDHLSLMVDLANDEKTFCEDFYDNFDLACEDLRYFDNNRK